MLDELGILQHHDAIAGTGKQHVADDYMYRLDKAIKENQEIYSKLIADKILSETGYNSSSQWTQCEKTNSTYLDCPVAMYSPLSNYTMSVAIQNPSTLNMTTARIAVPHGRAQPLPSLSP